MRNIKTIEADISKLQAELADVKDHESIRDSAVHILKNLGRYSLFPLPSMVEALISRGISQASIAGFFCVNQGHISRIHRGEYRGARCY